MPELPEVETTCCGIRPFIEDQRITKITVRNYKLRWPIPTNIADILTGQQIHTVKRRAKYLLFQCDTGTLIIHLGMSGSLRILDSTDNVEKHDHVDIVVDNGYVLRFTDPRRFGAILWTEQPIDQYKLLRHLGPEPLSIDFDADYLSQQSQSRKTSIKTFIMDGRIVVGVGNIYANEALFLAGIHPKTLTGKMSLNQCEKLVSAIKNVLTKAIAAGGTTLKDFRKSDGKPGYFAQQLHVYGRKEKPCSICGTVIQHYQASQRATYFCPNCQRHK
ncbi:MAG: DNA-formamidopyrimidine glycosylase [Methylophaga sp.]|nr:MAG: DNA-formamidopyrimidine glycosylase [Methylophaga sp.]